MPEGDVSLVDLELERVREWRKYYKDPLKYVKKMREVVRRRDPEARVLLFGSWVAGEARPDSDIDVLVVTRLAGDVRARLDLRMNIAREVGECTPFEVHIVTPEEFEAWYKRFLKEYVEV